MSTGSSRGPFEAVPRRLPIPPWSVAITSVWLGLVIVYELLKSGSSEAGPLCHLRRLTGVPCPTCGTTRLVLALLQGDFSAAFFYNPLVFAGVLVGCAWLVLRLGFGWALKLRLSKPQQLCLWLLLSALVLLNWAYVIWCDFSLS